MNAPRTPPSEQTNNLWYISNDSPSVIVFVHGIFSDSRSAWLTRHNDQEVYWPELITADARLYSPSVFLGGFHTALDAGRYDIADCSDELFNGLTVPDIQLRTTPIEKRRIVFVCHSTGGIVVRYMLTKHVDRFKDREVGLMLLASPSYGSRLADRLGGLARFYDNQLGLHLKWGNDLLKDIDDRFKELLDRRHISTLVGVEGCENHFVLHHKFFPSRQVVVDRESAGRYFTVRMLENTDHFSIVKPTGFDHPAHKLLVEFWLRQFGPPFESGLREYLDLSKEEMRERRLPYFTPALLFALLHPSGFGSSVLNSVRLGLATEVRDRCRRYLDQELPASEPGGFEEFDWFDREDVRLAQRLALEEHVSSITERILFKAVLLSRSNAVGQLKLTLGTDFDEILAEIERRKKRFRLTPGMDD